MSCLVLLEETITRFELTKMLSALFECLGLLEVNCKEIPSNGEENQETTVHKISGNDGIPHTN